MFVGSQKFVQTHQKICQTSLTSLSRGVVSAKLPYSNEMNNSYGDVCLSSREANEI